MWPSWRKGSDPHFTLTVFWGQPGALATVSFFIGFTSEGRSFLTAFMALRNKIAHPSGTLTWPSIEQMEKYIEFCEILARAFTEVGGVYAVTLPTRPSNAQHGAPADA